MMRTIPFWKMSGSGNDFVVVDHRTPQMADAEIRSFVTQICRRGLSVGADGVILLAPSRRADYSWRFYNADGSEAAMCGNGSRCVARYAYLKKIAPARHVIETAAGLVQAEVSDAGRVRVHLPDPHDMRLQLDIPVDSVTLEGHFIDTGVPHIVYFVDLVDAINVVRQGRATRQHPLFRPAGTNVNFVKVVDATTLKIRTYERGVEDETLACGTGAIAAAVIAAALGKVAPPVTVMTRGGIDLGIDFKQDGAVFTNVFLTGDARVVCTGEIPDEAWRV